MEDPTNASHAGRAVLNLDHVVHDDEDDDEDAPVVRADGLIHRIHDYGEMDPDADGITPQMRRHLRRVHDDLDPRVVTLSAPAHAVAFAPAYLDMQEVAVAEQVAAQHGQPQMDGNGVLCAVGTVDGRVSLYGVKAVKLYAMTRRQVYHESRAALHTVLNDTDVDENGKDERTEGGTTAKEPGDGEYDEHDDENGQPEDAEAPVVRDGVGIVDERHDEIDRVSRRLVRGNWRNRVRAAREAAIEPIATLLNVYGSHETAVRAVVWGGDVPCRRLCSTQERDEDKSDAGGDGQPGAGRSAASSGTVKGGSSRLKALRNNVDDGLLYSGDASGSIAVNDVFAGDEVWFEQGAHDHGVTALVRCAGPGGFPALASGDESGRVIIWDIRCGSLHGLSAVEVAGIPRDVLHPQGIYTHETIMGDEDDESDDVLREGLVRLHGLRPHPDCDSGVVSLSFDQPYVISAASDGQAGLIDMRKLREQYTGRKATAAGLWTAVDKAVAREQGRGSKRALRPEPMKAVMHEGNFYRYSCATIAMNRVICGDVKGALSMLSHRAWGVADMRVNVNSVERKLLGISGAGTTAGTSGCGSRSKSMKAKPVSCDALCKLDHQSVLMGDGAGRVRALSLSPITLHAVVGRHASRQPVTAMDTVTVPVMVEIVRSGAKRDLTSMKVVQIDESGESGTSEAPVGAEMVQAQATASGSLWSSGEEEEEECDDSEWRKVSRVYISIAVSAAYDHKLRFWSLVNAWDKVQVRQMHYDEAQDASEDEDEGDLSDEGESEEFDLKEGDCVLDEVQLAGEGDGPTLLVTCEEEKTIDLDGIVDASGGVGSYIVPEEAAAAVEASVVEEVQEKAAQRQAKKKKQKPKGGKGKHRGFFDGL